MKTSLKPLALWVSVSLGALLLIVAFATRGRWLPRARSWTQSLTSAQRPSATADTGASPEAERHGDREGHRHAGHSHAHDDADSLELSKQAQGNLGLTRDALQPIQLETFQRTLTVPGIVVERPGRTRLEVSTPMAGVLTRVHAVEGEAIRPGAVLFDLRITAEELVESQAELLKTVGDLDIENRELARLTKISESGAISESRLLERHYAKSKLENLLLAQREALRLHGLSEHQIDEIVDKRRLFRDLRIVAPTPGGSSHEIQLAESDIDRAGHAPATEDDVEPSEETPLIITSMPVLVGQTVAAGTTLAELADYSELYIEGRTFERDANILSRVTRNQWKVSALFEGAEREREIVPGLDLVYSAAEIHVESRTLPFYVRLPNDITSRGPSPNGHAFVEWRHRPGRRVQLLVPRDELKDQIVLPVEAIAREGIESYVFQQNGNHFERIPVRIKYRDANHVVVANDGSVFPGDVVARVGAHQMQMALKNKSGGGVDPHAGHSH